MFCPHCGYDNVPGTTSCARCRAPLPVDATAPIPQASRAGRAQQQAQAAQTARNARRSAPLRNVSGRTTMVPVNAHLEAERGTRVRQAAPAGYNPVHVTRRRFRWWMMLIILVLIALVLYFAGSAVLRLIDESQQRQLDQAAYVDAHERVTVNVTLELPEYLEGSSTPAPIRITGTDLDGNAVDQLELMSLTKHQVTLLRGTYTFTPAGSPVTSGGRVYACPPPVQVTLDAEGLHLDGQLAPDATGPTFAYTLLDPADVTNEQLDALRAWMTEAGFDGAELQAYIDAVAAARRTAGAEAASAEERAALQEQSHISTSDFRFDLPEYWWGKVDIVKGYDDESGMSKVTVLMKDSSYPIVEVLAVRASSTLLEGDTGNHLAYHAQRDGVRVEVWSRNWAYLANQQPDQISSTDLNRLVRLSTGGAMNYDEAVAAGADELTELDVQFITDELAPSIRFGGSSEVLAPYQEPTGSSDPEDDEADEEEDAEPEDEEDDEEPEDDEEEDDEE